MSEEKCKFYKKQFLSNYCELFKQPCYGKHCNFIKEFTRLNDLEQELQTSKEENEKLTQQNKQLREALEKIVKLKIKSCAGSGGGDINYLVLFEKERKRFNEGKNIAQQALKEGE